MQSAHVKACKNGAFKVLAHRSCIEWICNNVAQYDIHILYGRGASSYQVMCYNDNTAASAPINVAIYTSFALLRYFDLQRLAINEPEL